MKPRDRIAVALRHHTQRRVGARVFCSTCTTPTGQAAIWPCPTVTALTGDTDE